MAEMKQTLTAVLPCNDLDASEAFYGQLGFEREGEAFDPDYRILHDGRGGSLHLTRAVEDWLVPGKNPFGLYLYVEDVDGVATGLTDLIHKPKAQPWGMYEFALSDPDQTLVRVGWPSRLRTKP